MRWNAIPITCRKFFRVTLDPIDCLPIAMFHPQTTHIAIIGAGPAGAATALALSTHAPELRISLIEASDYRQMRFGETLHPAARLLLQRLQLWDAFLAENHAPSHGIISIWGQDAPTHNDFFTSLLGLGFHLDRCRFDAWMMTVAEQRGVRIMRQNRLTGAMRTDTGWRLQLIDADNRRIALDADFVVDAGGRRAPFARLVGARRVLYDRLIGAFLLFEDKQDTAIDSRTLIEASADGWWYGARLPGGRIAAACMTDVDITRRLSLAHRGAWLTAAMQAQHLSRWLGGAQPTGTPILCPAQAGRLDVCTGWHWLAVGDAAVSFDPLSGQGLVQALRGGISAAYAIADSLMQQPAASVRYAAGIDAEVCAFLSARDHYYALEQRWPDQHFWRRRQQRVELSPQQLLQAAPEADSHPASLLYLSQAQRRRVLDLCLRQRTAHEIVHNLCVETKLPARHWLLVLQYLIKIGALILMPHPRSLSDFPSANLIK